MTKVRLSPHAEPPVCTALAFVAHPLYIRAHSTHGLWCLPGEIRLKPPVAFEDKVQKCLCPWRLTGKDTQEWLCLISACASFWKLAFTSATRPIAGTRRWRPTSTAPATTFTSSTSRRRCLCCTRR